MTWPNDLSKVSPFHRESIADNLKRIQQTVAQSEGRGSDMVGLMAGNMLTLGGTGYVMRHLDLAQKAYQLDEQLPQNLKLLTSIVNNRDYPIEGRAKVLEVMILRGASNHAWGFLAKNEYQRAAMTAVIEGPPGLFDHLSRSRNQLPDEHSGRFPATEWMNSMLKEGGLLSQHKQREEVLIPWLQGLPAETRGQAMFHLRDAEGAREVGQISKMTGFEFSAGPVGFGLQWEGAKDTHWQVVGAGVLGQVSDHLERNPNEAAEFYEGYRRADRELPDAPSK